ncbi:hypothetical protein F383_35579 [Gossypium arboreum]|uniref:Uncharacterized protein n=1 Tax=Gossypium arboreum TaxID=29729 RepID=A0A0B0NQ33_GOSAR|nr:hypothetical protein F383_05429 [Gossypium arboreum]KHG29073.1 hypothetical protein F383_35579 [Gossypium arboreum]
MDLLSSNSWRVVLYSRKVLEEAPLSRSYLGCLYRLWVGFLPL